MLLPPPSGCADTFSPGYADCMPATTQPQCLHSKDAQFCLKLALPCAQPSHLASSLPQISSPVTPKWILQCIESEGHPFSRATLPISKARWIVGFFVFFFFSTSGTHWEHRVYLKRNSRCTWPLLNMAGPSIAFLRADICLRARAGLAGQRSGRWYSPLLQRLASPQDPHALIFRLSCQGPELNTLWAPQEFSLHLSRAFLLFIKSGQGVSD